VSWQALVKLSEIREDEVFPANVDGVDLILMRHADGVSAYLDCCPHEGAQLSFGERQGDVLICAKHLWEFDVRSGEHISRVPRPQFDLKKAPVRIVGDQVEVDVSSLVT
jgi:3-phenylpropionate/trans-cinnamate dioxygenase ferredoxin component